MNTSAATCAVCGTSTNIKTCSMCKNAYYCSREHQRVHYPIHQIYCRVSEKDDSDDNAVGDPHTAARRARMWIEHRRQRRRLEAMAGVGDDPVMNSQREFLGKMQGLMDRMKGFSRRLFIAMGMPDHEMEELFINLTAAQANMQRYMGSILNPTEEEAGNTGHSEEPLLLFFSQLEFVRATAARCAGHAVRGSFESGDLGRTTYGQLSTLLADDMDPSWISPETHSAHERQTVTAMGNCVANHFTYWAGGETIEPYLFPGPGKRAAETQSQPFEKVARPQRSSGYTSVLDVMREREANKVEPMIELTEEERILPEPMAVDVGESRDDELRSIVATWLAGDRKGGPKRFLESLVPRGATEEERRKQRFRVALKLAELARERWCEIAAANKEEAAGAEAIKQALEHVAAKSIVQGDDGLLTKIALTAAGLGVTAGLAYAAHRYFYLDIDQLMSVFNATLTDIQANLAVAQQKLAEAAKAVDEQRQLLHEANASEADLAEKAAEVGKTVQEMEDACVKPEQAFQEVARMAQANPESVDDAMRAALDTLGGVVKASASACRAQSQAIRDKFVSIQQDLSIIAQDTSEALRKADIIDESTAAALNSTQDSDTLLTKLGETMNTAAASMSDVSSYDAALNRIASSNRKFKPVMLLVKQLGGVLTQLEVGVVALTKQWKELSNDPKYTAKSRAAIMMASVAAVVASVVVSSQYACVLRMILWVTEKLSLGVANKIDNFSQWMRDKANWQEGYDLMDEISMLALGELAKGTGAAAAATPATGHTSVKAMQAMRARELMLQRMGVKAPSRWDPLLRTGSTTLHVGVLGVKTVARTAGFMSGLLGAGKMVQGAASTAYSTFVSADEVALAAGSNLLSLDSLLELPRIVMGSMGTIFTALMALDPLTWGVFLTSVGSVFVVGAVQHYYEQKRIREEEERAGAMFVAQHCWWGSFMHKAGRLTGRVALVGSLYLFYRDIYDHRSQLLATLDKSSTWLTQGLRELVHYIAPDALAPAIDYIEQHGSIILDWASQIVSAATMRRVSPEASKIIIKSLSCALGAMLLVIAIVRASRGAWGGVLKFFRRVRRSMQRSQPMPQSPPPTAIGDRFEATWRVSPDKKTVYWRYFVVNSTEEAEACEAVMLALFASSALAADDMKYIYDNDISGPDVCTTEPVDHSASTEDGEVMLHMVNDPDLKISPIILPVGALLPAITQKIVENATGGSKSSGIARLISLP
jgi:MYND finger